MKIQRLIPVFLIIAPFLFAFTTAVSADTFFSNHPILLAQNEAKPATTQVSQEGPSPEIVQYEMEKLERLKRNVGKRLIYNKTGRPAEICESPEDPTKKMTIIKDKDTFTVVGVVQNRLGTMYFYQVKFDSGQTGYMEADARYLEIKIKEGSLKVAQEQSSTKKKGMSQSAIDAMDAIELVKKDLLPGDSATGEKWTVEKKMIALKEKPFPKLHWKYEAKIVSKDIYRVTMTAAEGKESPLIRTWLVDLSLADVRPENLAAKEIYLK